MDYNRYSIQQQALSCGWLPLRLNRPAPHPTSLWSRDGEHKGNGRQINRFFHDHVRCVRDILAVFGNDSRVFSGNDQDLCGGEIVRFKRTICQGSVSIQLSKTTLNF